MRKKYKCNKGVIFIMSFFGILVMSQIEGVSTEYEEKNLSVTFVKYSIGFTSGGINNCSC